MKINRLLFVFFASVLLLFACGSRGDAKIDRPKDNPSVQEPQMNGNLTVMTADELNQFELLRANWTEDQMIQSGLEKQANELAGERTYSNQSVTYSYGNIYGNNKTPDFVDVHGTIDGKGPRDIAVGDTFDGVLNKFPREKDWRTSENGEFYGKVSKESVVPTGFVSDNKKEIIIWPQEQVPRLVIFFKDGAVEHYTIYIQNIFD